MRIKVNEEVWALGITVQRAGTQNPNAYYIPIKTIVGRIEELSWGRIFHVQPKNKKVRTFRRRNITNLANHFGYNKNMVSRSWNKVKRIADEYNKAVFRRKNH